MVAATAEGMAVAAAMPAAAALAVAVALNSPAAFQAVAPVHAGHLVSAPGLPPPAQLRHISLSTHPASPKISPRHASIDSSSSTCHTLTGCIGFTVEPAKTAMPSTTTPVPFRRQPRIINVDVRKRPDSRLGLRVDFPKVSDRSHDAPSPTDN